MAVAQANARPDYLGQAAGLAADAIDGTMMGLSMVPGLNLAGDTYWTLKGAKSASQGDWLSAAADWIPMGSSVIRTAPLTY